LTNKSMKEEINEKESLKEGEKEERRKARKLKEE
jgi:hypothetical protein